MSIKYYQLAKDEELPDEFCAVRDVGGEPSEYTFYVPEAENAKLRELLAENNEELAKMRRAIDYLYSFAKACGVDAEDMRELGVEVK